MNLQRQSYQEYQELEKLKLSQLEKEKRIKEFQATFSGRLQTIIESSGATLKRFTKQGNNYVVTYVVGGQTVKSTIKDTFRIISAGFCLENDDKRHSLASLILTAQEFQKEAPLYLTRE